MTGRQIEVIVLPDGEIGIDAVGFKGPDCEQATRFLEEALGEVGVRRKKPAYHARTETQRRQQVGGQ